MIRCLLLQLANSILLVYLLQINAADAGCDGRYEGQQWNEGNCKICFCHKQSVMCGSICGRGKAISDVFHKGPTSQSVRNNLIATALSNTNSKSSCRHSGKTRQHKETWVETNHHASSVKRGKECMLCHCNKRIVSCTIRFCPPVTCLNPVRKRGSCCQYCPEHQVELKGCSSFGSLFEQGSKWKVYVPNAGKNECLSCSCQKSGCKSSLKCQRLVCPVLTCPQQIYKAGECCKTCKDGKTSQTMVSDEMFSLQTSGFDLFDALKDSTAEHSNGEVNDECDEDKPGIVLKKKRESKEKVIKKPAKGPKG